VENKRPIQLGEESSKKSFHGKKGGEDISPPERR